MLLVLCSGTTPDVAQHCGTGDQTRMDIDFTPYNISPDSLTLFLCPIFLFLFVLLSAILCVCVYMHA